MLSMPFCVVNCVIPLQGGDSYNICVCILSLGGNFYCTYCRLHAAALAVCTCLHNSFCPAVDLTVRLISFLSQGCFFRRMSCRWGGSTCAKFLQNSADPMQRLHDIGQSQRPTYPILTSILRTYVHKRTVQCLLSHDL